MSSIDIISAQAAKYKWLLALMILILGLVYFGKQEEGSQGIPNSYIILGALLVGGYFLTRRKSAETLTDGYKLAEFINSKESMSFGLQWDFSSPTIEHLGSYMLIQPKSGPTFVFDEFMNLKVRSPLNIYKVKQSLESSEILRAFQMKNINESKLKEALKEKGIIIENDEETKGASA